jgi:hypothetical protein
MRRDDEGVAAALIVTRWLHLAASPVLALMALMTLVLDSGMPNALCSAAAGT